MFKKFLSSLAKNPWKSYATSIGAEYVDGGFQSDRIIVHKDNITIIISLGTNQRGNRGFRYTRFRCSYTSEHAPYFSIKNPKTKSLFSKKKPELLPIPQLYNITTPKEELFSILCNDDQFCYFLNNLFLFKYSFEKDDGEYGPIFLTHEHQLCLELEGEIEEEFILTMGIGIILATIHLFRNNGLLNPEKSSVSYY